MHCVYCDKKISYTALECPWCHHDTKISIAAAADGFMYSIAGFIAGAIISGAFFGLFIGVICGIIISALVMDIPINKVRNAIGLEKVNTTKYKTVVKKELPPKNIAPPIEKPIPSNVIKMKSKLLILDELYGNKQISEDEYIKKHEFLIAALNKEIAEEQDQWLEAPMSEQSRKLKTLDELHKRNMITQTEYYERRKKILENL